MSAAAKAGAGTTRADRQLRILRHRALELAARVKAGELQFIDAVDVCANAAEAAGMYELPGYVLPGGYVITGADLVQVTLAECFGPVRSAGLAP
jgi:hypothetical protein